MEYKDCKRCLKVLSIDNFRLTKGKPCTYCKICKSIMDKESYQRNKEKRLAACKEYNRKRKENFQPKQGEKECKQCKAVKSFSEFKADFRDKTGCKSVCEHCKKSNKLKVSRSKAKTSESFIQEAVNKFGDRYDYSLVNYVSSVTKVKIICPEHGVFEQQPATHLKSSVGCVHCGNSQAGKNRSIKDFTDRALKLHNGRYDYSKVDYKRSDINVEIICTEHGSFWQTPQSHLRGFGCHKCDNRGGYTPTKPGCLYIFVSEGLVKIGISNYKVAKRLRSVNRNSGLKFKLYKVFENEDGKIIEDAEAFFLKKLSEKYYNPVQKFSGYTECFYGVDAPLLAFEIEQFLERFK